MQKYKINHGLTKDAFCSKKCASNYMTTKVTLACCFCGNKYAVKKAREHISKYCSIACKFADERVVFTCDHCGKQYVRRKSYVKSSPVKNGKNYCSMACKKAHCIGDNACNWREGLTNKNDRIRRRKMGKEWKIAVANRDNNTCQKCGAENQKMHIHHVKPLSQYPELAYEVDNGLTLCMACHGVEHGQTFTH
jgi:5-methylcytosine-specific restriction endonuclease McrA